VFEAVSDANPAADDREDREDYQRSKHHPRRFVWTMSVRVVPAMSVIVV